MNLDRIAVEIRPRNQWEAVDMGVVLARKWFFKLWLIWAVAATPILIIVILISFALPWSTALLSLLFFWLCKPLFEPPLLHWVSRALFGEHLGIRQTIKDVRKESSFRRFMSVWFTRINPMRSFTLPVLFLEGLTGSGQKQRIALLSHGYETSIYLNLACSFIEMLLSFSLISLIYWLIPDELRWVDYGDFIFKADMWIILIAYCASCSVLTPFFISCGFLLYLSRRVELEAWDIEIGFKRINKKRKAGKSRKKAIYGCLLYFILISTGAFYQTSAIAETTVTLESAKEFIQEVVKQNDFGEKKTVNRWVAKEKEQAPNDSDWLKAFEPILEFLRNIAEIISANIATFSKYVVWGCAGCVIAFLLLKHSKIHTWLTTHLKGRPSHFTPPKTLFGMDVSPESLPEDIVSIIVTLLDQDQKRDALSLLYRSVLSKLVNNHHVEVHTFQTENECCEVVDKARPKEEASYFLNLTKLWLTTAYGHQDPDMKLCRNLVQQWQHFYGS